MGRLPLHRFANRVHGERHHGIEPQKEHVHQVFLTDAAGGKVGVQQAQAAQAFLPAAPARQFGNHDAARLAHNNHLHPALAVNKQAQLPPHGA